MPIIIQQHCVPIDSKTQLSPLQTELLNRPEKVRIADAPTGAGKSYAFQKAMLNGERILFIVPTRRLAQNLIRQLMENLEKMGWDSAKIEAKIALWSSDKTQQLKEEGFKEIGARRIREISGLDSTQEDGEMIVAVPEVVSHLLLRDPRSIKSGQADAGIFDFLAGFDHIVFDEFHTITARGFGLAAVFAKLATDLQSYRAKVSFLSATPLNIQPVLEKFEVAESQIISLHETINKAAGRVIHGDVQLCFETATTLADLLAHHIETVKAEIAKERQVVIIYNALVDLQQQIVQLEQIIQQIGIDPQDCLLINSLDDSRPEVKAPGRFAVGRTQPPEKFKILIATSSIEMGVTFAANVLLMEPGIEPLNFLQRYGRAARGDHNGQVIVRVDNSLKKSQPWIRKLLYWAEQHDEQTISIQALTEQLTQSVIKAFKTPITEKSSHFGQLPSRAAYTAGLYWQALIQHQSNQGHRAKQLMPYTPKPAKMIYALLKQVRQMEQDRQFGKAVKKWCDRFEAEIKILRDIGRSIRVIESDGHPFTARILWLQRYAPEILNTGYWTTGDDGCEEIRFNGHLCITDQRQYVPEEITVCFPNTQLTALLKADNELVKNWCRLLRDSSGPESLAWDLFPEAMAAAETLVQKTGLIVSDEEELSFEAQTGVW